MKKVVLALTLIMALSLLLMGCTSGPKYNYPTGYAAYGGGGQQGGGGYAQQNNYVGGGCAVSGPDMTLDVSTDVAVGA